MMAKALFLAVLSATALAACTAIEPARVAPPSLETSRQVTHADLDAVQRRFVDEKGLVNYHALRREPGQLDRYYLWLAEESPDSNPERFPTREDALAYWINAYNASVLVTVLRYYPIASVTDVPATFPLGLIDDKIGFFFLQEVQLGGESTNFYDLENSLIRSRYQEPRIHFAINCASLGCPQLPQEAFTSPRLDEQLDREARRFFARHQNLHFDHDAETVWLSPILDWYESDFTQWLEQHHPDRPATLLEYVSLYAPKEHEAALLRARDEGYEIDFIEYDWGLNDQTPTAKPH